MFVLLSHSTGKSCVHMVRRVGQISTSKSVCLLDVYSLVWTVWVVNLLLTFVFYFKKYYTSGYISTAFIFYSSTNLFNWTNSRSYTSNEISAAVNAYVSTLTVLVLTLQLSPALPLQMTPQLLSTLSLFNWKFNYIILYSLSETSNALSACTSSGSSNPFSA